MDLLKAFVHNNTKIQLKVLYLENFLVFDNLTLNFNCLKYSVIIIKNSNIPQTNVNAIMTAFKFIFQSDYTAEEARQLLKNSEINGQVKIVFNMNEPSQKFEVIRTIKDPTRITFIDDKATTYFDFKYFIANYINPFRELDFNTLTDNDNLLHFFYKELWTSHKYYDSDSIFSPAVVTIEDQQQLQVNRMTEIALKLQEFIIWRKNPENIKIFMILAKAINEIFQRLTCNNYEVHFVIGKYLKDCDNINAVELDAVFSLENLSDDIKTIIVSSNGHYTIWTKAERHLILLIKLSVQIALSLFNKQNIIFIGNLLDLEHIQNEELVKTVMIMNYCETNRSNCVDVSKWKFNNFVQNIIDVCEENELLAIFKYNDFVPIKNANIINCKINQNKEFIYEIKDEIFNMEQILQTISQL